MTLRQYYNDLPRHKQVVFREKWMKLKQKSRNAFYVMLRDASESDIRLFSESTGVDANEVYKPIQTQLDIFNSKNSKYRKVS